MSPHIVQNPADNGGCCFYRIRFPALALQTFVKGLHIDEFTKLTIDQNYYKGVRVVRVQRQVTDDQCEFILKYLRPITEISGSWLMYEVDDVIGMHDFPRYNGSWNAYQNERFMDNVKKVFEVIDFLTVTCPALGDYYVKNFGIDKRKVIVLPNYLPRWWIDNIYEVEKISKRFDVNKANRQKICFLSSSSHFDHKNVNGGVDDFTHILPFITKNLNKYGFVFVGGVPRQLRYPEFNGKFTIIPWFDILNYPSLVNKIGADIVIAPLLDNVFNRCKSNIKFLEMASMGILPICQNLTPYQGYATDLFDNSDDLEQIVDRYLSDKDLYMNRIIHNRQYIDNPQKPWWLENNLSQWIKLLVDIPQRTMRADLTKIINEKKGQKCSPISDQKNGQFISDI